MEEFNIVMVGRGNDGISSGDSIHTKTRRSLSAAMRLANKATSTPYTVSGIHEAHVYHLIDGEIQTHLIYQDGRIKWVMV